jgi:hypothetical protein
MAIFRDTHLILSGHLKGGESIKKSIKFSGLSLEERINFLIGWGKHRWPSSIDWKLSILRFGKGIAMATDYRLTPMPPDRPKRWRKIDDGLPQIGYSSRFWYCRVLRGETKAQSYRRCWAEWQKVEQRLLALGAPPLYKVLATTTLQYDPPRPISIIDEQQSMEQLGLVYQNNPKFRENLDRSGLRVADFRPGGVLMETLPQVEIETENPEQFVKALAIRQPAANSSGTVAAELDAQFEMKQTLARARQMAVKTANRFKQKVDHFVRWVGAAFSVGSINDSTLLDYHGQLCKEIADGKRTAGGAQDQLSSVTHFIRTAFCPRGTLQTLPRVLQVARSPLVFVDVEEREIAKGWCKLV